MSAQSPAGPDYAAAINAYSQTAPGDLAALLDAAIAPIGGRAATLYLADFGQTVLQPLLLSAGWGSGDWDADDEALHEQDLATTMAGRCFSTGAPVTAERTGGTRVWVPLVEHSQRTGVLALTVCEPSEAVLASCVEVGRFAGLLVASAARFTDVFHLRRRGRSMTAAAGMQWDLLPSLTMRTAEVVSSGSLEPAYEVAGDAFDHSINGDRLHVALFDGMGHDLPSTLMSTLAVGVYRHARRAGLALTDMYDAVDSAVAGHCPVEGFVTGLLLRLDLSTGALQWLNAGHPAPLLMRGRHFVGELECPVALPFGLRGPATTTGAEQLQPGDSVLLYTDGVVESGPGGAEDLGAERLGDLWAREALMERPAEEVARRLTQAVLEYQGGKLHDDATVVVVQWHGPLRPATASDAGLIRRS